jgi:hypothetical protein
MSQTWSIKIMPVGDEVRFDPDVFGIEPGQPLKAQEGDLVSWNNRTNRTVVVAVKKAGTNETSFATGLIESFQSSSPGYVIQDTDIDTKGASGGVVGVVRYNATYMLPGTPPNIAPETFGGTITVVSS